MAIRIVAPACVEIVNSAPDNHFAACPHCRVPEPGTRVVGGVGGCPTIGAGIVSRSVQIAEVTGSSPDDHFTACPHCRMWGSGSGRPWEAGGCPSIGARVVFSPGIVIVQVA